MTFTQAMGVECDSCHQPASQHRLTEAGVLYCLELRTDSSAKWKFKFERANNKLKMTERRFCLSQSVRNLRRGVFPVGTGEALQGALTSFVSTEQVGEQAVLL